MQFVPSIVVTNSVVVLVGTRSTSSSRLEDRRPSERSNIAAQRTDEPQQSTELSDLMALRVSELHSFKKSSSSSELAAFQWLFPFFFDDVLQMFVRMLGRLKTISY